MTAAQETWDLLTCEVDKFGNQVWRDENGRLHRENGPAVIRADGTQYWLKHGKCHRENGPAYIRLDGYVQFWLDDEPMSEEEFNARKLTVNK